MAPLTTRQRQVYDFLVERIGSGLPPTLRDLRDHLGCSSPTAAVCHLKILEERGLIVREPGKARAIRLAQ
jgi:repressor LexA